jgi:tRNA(Ile)-lysidine synthase
MHLLRGTGMAGLRGLQPLLFMQPGGDTIQIKIIRPLLNTSRNETEEYCRQHRLDIRHDSSNQSTAFFRNRIRLELLPELRDYNPRIDDALLRMARSAEEDVSYLEAQASIIWNDLAIQKGNALYLDLSKIIDLHPALQKQLFRMAIEKIAGTLKDIESDHIEQMVLFMAKPSGKTLHLPHGLRLSTEYGYLVLTGVKSQTGLCPFPPLETIFPLHVPGDTLLPGWLVRTHLLDTPVEMEENGFTALLDLDLSGTELYVRTRQRGDRFQPLGMDRTKKLQDFMVDAKIPASWRSHIPLLCTGTQILWLVGWRIDDKFKVTGSTKKFLQVTFVRSD